MPWYYVNEPKLDPVCWPPRCLFVHGRPQPLAQILLAPNSNWTPHLPALVKTKLGGLRHYLDTHASSRFPDPRGESCPLPFPGRGPTPIPCHSLSKVLLSTKALPKQSPNKAGCLLPPPCGCVLSLSSHQILELDTSAWRRGFGDQGIGIWVCLPRPQDRKLANRSWTALSGWDSTFEKLQAPFSTALLGIVCSARLPGLISQTTWW